ncbi:MAG TPA: hypothetical protein PKH24_19780 [Sedimentisphaerales bacterium]|jgi:hypothetical protein|nr:hypothetical protein [Sedimentisphaerales bacterium]HNU31381.1 hypothetical protein [Sedimentisphaerales bacterium]
MSVTMLPMVILPLTFLFVLLIILLCKAPKAGAWIVGGLLLLAPLVLYRFAKGGGLAHDEEVIIPLFVLPAVFLFVLLVILLAKAPKAGIAMVVALVVMVLAGGFIVAFFSHSRTVYAPEPVVYPQIGQRTHPSAAVAVIDGDSEVVYQNPVDTLVVPSPPSAPLSPIWSEGVEQEFDADVYPSKLAAVQAIGRRIEKAVRELVADANSPVRITLFQEVSDPVLMSHLRILIQRVMPQAACAIEVDLRDLQPNEVGVTLMLSGVDMQTAPWSQSNETRIADGMVHVHVFTMARRIILQKQFVEAPWIDNFGTFASVRPERAFIVARSNGSCMSEGEAHQQALADAYSQVTGALSRQSGGSLVPGLPEAALTTTDVLNGGFLVDRFVQSFDASTGKIWRQAFLVDVSGPKLARLAQVKAAKSYQVRESWAWMGLSVVGVLALISVIYFFLNMATRGYYEWSLRIAGVILAVVAIVSILMIVH